MKELCVDPRAKGLIFDLDGTLLDSMPLHLELLDSMGCVQELVVVGRLR